MANNSSNDVPSIYSSACFMKFPFYDTSKQDLPDTAYPTWTVITAVNGLAAPPTIIINALIIWTLMRDENFRSSPFNMALIFLAMTDFLVGLIVQPLFCLFLTCIMSEDCQISADCAFTSFILPALIINSLSMSTLAVACAERYTAIEHQTFYRNNITTSRLLKILIATWIINLAFLLSSVFLLQIYLDDDYSKKIPPAIAVVFYGIIILYCTSRVQLTAYRQRKDIDRQIASVQQTTEQREQKLEEFKKVFLLTLLVVSSVIFYMPFFVTTVIRQATKINNVTVDSLTLHAPIIEFTLIFLQSLVNPIVMTLRLSYVRKRIKKKLSCFLNVVQQSEEEHQ